MVQLESSFHAETKKISKHLTKLKQYLSSSDSVWKQEDAKGTVNTLDMPI